MLSPAMLHVIASIIPFHQIDILIFSEQIRYDDAMGEWTLLKKKIVYYHNFYEKVFSPGKNVIRTFSSLSAYVCVVSRLLKLAAKYIKM